MGLYREGLSFSIISNVLYNKHGMQISRDACIGRVNRILKRKGGGARQQPKERRVAHVCVQPKNKPVRVAAPVVEEPEVIDNGMNVSMLNVSDETCRWPIGDPQEDDFHFCGFKPKKGSPYCEHHARKAYRPHKHGGHRD
jgi:GcrA cell cycle regulator